VNERSKNRHFQRPHSQLTPPLQRTPANICINLKLPETTFPGLHFAADNIWVALQIFEQFCPKAGDTNPLGAEPKTNFNAKRPFKVIQGHLFRYRWRATKGIAHYNKCGLECEGSEDIASERSENRYFRQPYSHLTPPLQRTPANIRIKIILLETRIPVLYLFAADSIGLSSFTF